MKLLYFAFTLILPLLMLSCSSDDPADAAVSYVKMLDEGKTDELIDHIYGCDSAKAEYREHMISIYGQMSASVLKECGRIKNVEVVKVDNHEAEGYADVILHIVFESNAERDILISLVRHNDEWQLK